MAHTPGPWRQAGYAVIRGEGTEEERIAIAGDYDTDDVSATHLANARLIAAAPDLLAALTAAQEVIHGFFCGDKGPPAWEGKCAKECTQAKAAIAKASPQAR